MATIKKAASKKPVTEHDIISLYMNSVLENNGVPKNIYLFCKENQIDEQEFYSHFGSFDGLRQAVWSTFFYNAKSVIGNDPGYANYANKDKLLTLYFTLFEILTLNRSYVLYSLKDNDRGLKNLTDLKQFRTHFKGFVTDLLKATPSAVKEKAKKITDPVYAEGAWVQFLFILKFWIDDQSKGFEKTDVVIEKSVNTVVGLLDTTPLENLIDLGKFLWKEGKIR